MADAVGLIVLAGLTAVCAVFVPSSEVPKALFFFAFFVLALIGLYFWHNEKWPQNPLVLLLIVVLVTVIGTINLGVDALIGHNQSHPFALLKAVTSTGDGVLTIIAYPSLIFVGLAGIVRSIYLNKTK